MSSYLSNGVSIRTYKGIYEDEGEYTFELLAYGQKDDPRIIAEVGPHGRTICGILMFKNEESVKILYKFSNYYSIR